MNEYPEHEKLRKIQDKSQEIGEFLDWLMNTKDIELCNTIEEDIRPWMPITESKENLLGEYFNIDSKKLEEEKRQMLDSIR